jgi:hypothetical protein
MTPLWSILTATLAAAAMAAGGVLAPESGPADAPAALVIDAAAARDGREPVDPRLREVDAEVRLPRTAAEAVTNVRYFAALGRRVVVAGPVSAAAAEPAGVSVVRAHDLDGASGAHVREYSSVSPDTRPCARRAAPRPRASACA